MIVAGDKSSADMTSPGFACRLRADHGRYPAVLRRSPSSGSGDVGRQHRYRERAVCIDLAEIRCVDLLPGLLSVSSGLVGLRVRLHREAHRPALCPRRAPPPASSGGDAPLTADTGNPVPSNHTSSGSWSTESCPSYENAAVARLLHQRLERIVARWPMISMQSGLWPAPGELLQHLLRLPAEYCSMTLIPKASPAASALVCV